MPDFPYLALKRQSERQKMIFKILEEIEELLNKKEIAGYRIEINTVDKMYLLDKPEREKQNTNAIGFEMPSKNDYGE